CQQHNTFPYSF
nr:immunoglobulin light chain junction region [Macaca mulatta]MOW61896.1 immunoglobulin light chain junction region [Macaca mulatta]MOW62567.1 immunoglobulin light chain junction region [Macaca mulatta]MOW62772.1 immunoglobulin light chain junction region [Macaca mulatta]MOW62788.1 immunoglobulin light chain junction region [Macaca mulatta]